MGSYDIQRLKIEKTLQHNGRFGASGGVARLTVCADIQPFAPFRAVVNPPPASQAASTLAAIGRHVPSLNTLTLFSTTLLNNGVREKSALPKNARQKLQF